MCGQLRANEQFSAHGRRNHLCRECRKLPAAEKERRRALLHLEGMLAQSRISEKNVRYLRSLASSPAAGLSNLAKIT
jgi:hypothetical protein